MREQQYLDVYIDKTMVIVRQNIQKDTYSKMCSPIDSSIKLGQLNNRKAAKK